MPARAYCKVDVARRLSKVREGLLLYKAVGGLTVATWMFLEREIVVFMARSTCSVVWRSRGWPAGSRRTATNSHRWKDDVVRSSCDSRLPPHSVISRNDTLMLLGLTSATHYSLVEHSYHYLAVSLTGKEQTLVTLLAIIQYTRKRNGESLWRPPLAISRSAVIASTRLYRHPPLQPHSNHGCERRTNVPLCSHHRSNFQSRIRLSNACRPRLHPQLACRNARTHHTCSLLFGSMGWLHCRWPDCAPDFRRASHSRRSGYSQGHVPNVRSG